MCVGGGGGTRKYDLFDCPLCFMIRHVFVWGDGGGGARAPSPSIPYLRPWSPESYFMYTFYIIICQFWYSMLHVDDSSPL